MAGRHRTVRASNARRALATLLTAAAVAVAWVAVGVTGAGGTFAAWNSSATLPGTTLHTASSVGATAPSGPVTPSQLGISNGTGGTVVGVDLPTGDSQWASAPNGNIDTTTSRITNQYYVCMVIAVRGTTTAPADWSFTLDTSVAPFNGVALTQSAFAPSGAQTARITAFPTGNGHTYTIAGIHQGSATAVDQLVNGDAANPDGYQNHTWTTPLSSSQTAHVHLCVTVNAAAPVVAASSTTYTVAQPVLAGCPSQNPATAAGSAALSSPIPAGGNGATVCLYVKVTGLYPHFYAGYTATANWAAAVNSSRLTASQKTALLAATPSDAEIYGSDGTQSSAGAPTRANNVFTWTETDQHTPLAITNGIDVVLALTFPLPAA